MTVKKTNEMKRVHLYNSEYDEFGGGAEHVDDFASVKDAQAYVEDNPAEYSGEYWYILEVVSHAASKPIWE